MSDDRLYKAYKRPSSWQIMPSEQASCLRCECEIASWVQFTGTHHQGRKTRTHTQRGQMHMPNAVPCMLVQMVQRPQHERGLHATLLIMPFVNHADTTRAAACTHATRRPAVTNAVSPKRQRHCPVQYLRIYTYAMSTRPHEPAHLSQRCILLLPHRAPPPDRVSLRRAQELTVSLNESAS